MTTPAELILKPGKERSLERRHPWVYASAIGKVVGKPAAGATVAVRSIAGKFLAWAAYSPESTLRARCWSFVESETIDSAWFVARIHEAVAARADLVGKTEAIRLVFGEADLLPGLIVDRYGDQLVTQFQGTGVDAQRAVLTEALVAATGCRNVYDRSDAATRKREGLPEEALGLLAGEEPPEVIEIAEHGVRYGVDIHRGHKTGFYIDQRDNRAAARRIAEEFRARHGRGLRALNCFCYTGGFSLALLAGGAEEVISIDSSADALAMAQANAERNGFGPDRARWVEANVFEELRRLREAGETFDLIVLDPPKFAASHHHVDRAARAYKDINLSGLRLLNPAGHLLTFSCSGAIDSDLFQKIVAGAVFDAKVDAWMLERLGAGSDHPLLMTHPEGEYLKGLHLRLRA